MFNWLLLLCLVLVSVPGLLVAIPRLMQRLEKTAISKLPPGKTPPPRSVLIAATLGQSLLLVSAAAAVGTVLAPGVGLQALFFQALVSGRSLWDALEPQLLPALILCVGGALAIISRPQLRGQRDGDFHAQSLALFDHFPKPQPPSSQRQEVVKDQSTTTPGTRDKGPFDEDPQVEHRQGQANVEQS